MEITSSSFENDASIPPRFTCDGDDVNPPFDIVGVPKDATSLVLIMEDPDAPVPGGWVHWTIFNIDPTTKEIKENSAPEAGIEGLTSFGKSAYGGPCPPSGTHRYQIKLYALDTMLDLDSSAKREDIESAMKGHVMDEDVLAGLYQRQK